MPGIRDDFDVIDKMGLTEFDKTFRKKIKKPEPEFDNELEDLIGTLENMESDYGSSE